VSVSVPHAVSVWRRNAAMYRRTWWLNILPNFFEPVLYLLSIGLGVGAYITEMGGTSYAAFLAPGLVCVAAMNGASFEVTYNIFVRLTFEKQYDAMLTTPIQPDDVLFGEILWAVSRAAVYGTTFFIVVALFGLAPLPRALLMLPVIPLAGLLFAAIGIAFSLRIPTIEVFSFYFTLFLTPLFLFSDVFFPLKERLSLTYWHPDHDTCNAVCGATWEDAPEQRRAGWRRFAEAPAPVGYDPSIIPAWTSPEAEAFGILRVEPVSLRVMDGSRMVRGTGRLLTWRAS